MSFLRRTALALPLLVIGACTTSESCASVQCPDLHVFDHDYLEWRTVDAAWADKMMHPFLHLQEVGNATYPECKAAGNCSGDKTDDFEGLGATDAWAVVGIDPQKAVLGLEEGSKKLAVYVAVGTDPETLAPKMDPAMFG